MLPSPGVTAAGQPFINFSPAMIEAKRSLVMGETLEPGEKKAAAPDDKGGLYELRISSAYFLTSAFELGRRVI